MSTKLCIIRHGETDWNCEGRIQGQLDIPLNEVGHEQALAAAFNSGHHRFEAVISSDLTRTMQTAKALALREDLPVTQMEGLRERHYGIFQGVTKSEAPDPHPEIYPLYKARDLHYDFETGESLTNFAQRVHDSFLWLVRHYEDQQIAVITHAGVLDIMYRTATDRPLETERDFVIPNSALNWFHHDGAGWHLDKWDDHHHATHVIMDAPE